jgi:uncharacterized protein (TIGR00255 family)
MALQSMTGFARAAGDHHGAAVAWELRSVNGKTLEARLRLPPGHERLEPAARQAIQKAFSRGNVQASLNLSATGRTSQPVVNEAFLREVAQLARRLQDEFAAAPPTADGLLGLRGVLDVPEVQQSDEERTAFDAAVLALLDKALRSLAAARATEGAALGAVLAGQVAKIETLTLAAEADPSREPAVIRARLAEQVRLLLDTSTNFDEARLHTEAALLATRADIREEIDRLKTHVAAARVLLAEGGPVGRRLDFLAQEFNREANTLCSKSNAASVTAIGLKLKAVVDQFREQVQNLE